MDPLSDLLAQPQSAAGLRAMRLSYYRFDIQCHRGLTVPWVHLSTFCPCISRLSRFAPLTSAASLVPQLICRPIATVLRFSLLRPT